MERRRLARRTIVDLVNLVGIGATVLVTLIAVLRAVTASVPAPARSLSADERRAVAQALAAQEPRWRAQAEKLFPGDRWSQDDDFFNQEHRAVRQMAAARGTSSGEILHAIDEELRSAPANRKVGAAPVKPRPFYD